ncbi:MAG TPA: hypothetical protein VFE82_16015 [Ramlibacter sp.]|jgi:hypothetical protein|uniref:hypothetical protein n=1 Tax=Ramlibacter sp. TaxID=1917967 RepID=UPI002D377CCC|nr:hypothetical protein [Ramlibacter sp.]HZY19978.1 hypothetical protein [Ramlibacter sp.]
MPATAPTLINPTLEDAHWHRAFRDEPYYRAGLDYRDYGPAFRVGYTAPMRRSGRFHELEGVLQEDWERVRGTSRLDWSEARQAIEAAWDRVCPAAQPA